jgi:hypothetical protein
MKMEGYRYILMELALDQYACEPLASCRDKIILNCVEE